MRGCLPQQVRLTSHRPWEDQPKAHGAGATSMTTKLCTLPQPWPNPNLKSLPSDRTSHLRFLIGPRARKRAGSVGFSRLCAMRRHLGQTEPSYPQAPRDALSDSEICMVDACLCRTPGRTRSERRTSQPGITRYRRGVKLLQKSTAEGKRSDNIHTKIGGCTNIPQTSQPTPRVHGRLAQARAREQSKQFQAQDGSLRRAWL